MEKIVENALFVLGIHVLFWDGMVLSWAKKYLSALPVFLRKPLYECAVCMSSLWGVLFYFKGVDDAKLFFYKIDARLSMDCVVHLLSLCGLMVIIDSAIHYWRRSSNSRQEKLLG